MDNKIFTITITIESDVGTGAGPPVDTTADPSSPAVTSWNEDPMEKLAPDIAARSKEKCSPSMVLVSDVIVSLDFGTVPAPCTPTFPSFFGISSGRWNFSITYSSSRFLFSVILRFVDCFGVSGFFSCLLTVVTNSGAAALTSAVGNENVGEIDENGNALNVGEGVSNVNAVNDGEVP